MFIPTIPTDILNVKNQMINDIKNENVPFMESKSKGLSNNLFAVNIQVDNMKEQNKDYLNLSEYISRTHKEKLLNQRLLISIKNVKLYTNLKYSDGQPVVSYALNIYYTNQRHESLEFSTELVGYISSTDIWKQFIQQLVESNINMITIINNNRYSTEKREELNTIVQDLMKPYLPQTIPSLHELTISKVKGISGDIVYSYHENTITVLPSYYVEFTLRDKNTNLSKITAINMQSLSEISSSKLLNWYKKTVENFNSLDNKEEPHSTNENSLPTLTTLTEFEVARIVKNNFAHGTVSSRKGAVSSSLRYYSNIDYSIQLFSTFVLDVDILINEKNNTNTIDFHLYEDISNTENLTLVQSFTYENVSLPLLNNQTTIDTEQLILSTIPIVNDFYANYILVNSDF